MSAAGRLREAAAVLRERAEAAPGGPWVYSEKGNIVDGPTDVEVRSHETSYPVMTGAYDSHDGEAAAYIAMMHPPVAKAMAKVLEAQAERAADMAEAIRSEALAESVIRSSIAGLSDALALADAILGGDS